MPIALEFDLFPYDKCCSTRLCNIWKVAFLLEDLRGFGGTGKAEENQASPACLEYWRVNRLFILT